MLFNSFDFFLFLLFVFAIFWLLPNNKKWVLLLISSYVFYMYWNPIYILLLLLTTIIDFYISLYLTSSDNPKRSRKGIVLSLILGLAILFSFKYIGFFLLISQQVLALIGIDYVIPEMNILLPMGISFYTFQSISYAIDVYRKDIKPERNFFYFSLYITYFPQLVAGPIERASQLLPQLKKKQFNFTSNHLKIGIFYIVWGLFLKVVIADNAAFIVDSIFDNLEEKTGGNLAYGALLFTFQIYTDFAGYSFMAIGISKLFDIQLMANFNSPFLSESVSDFWKRWHISLSNWVRDYIYIPLGGNRKGAYRTYINLFIAFIIIGIWHGASYNFIIWGFLHGLVMVFERVFKLNITARFSLIRILKTVSTFLIITFIFISFRIENVHQLYTIYGRIFTLDWRDFLFFLSDNRYNFVFLGIFILLMVELYLKKRPLATLTKIPQYIFYPFCILLFFSIVFLGRAEGGQFIYFQF